MGRPPIGKQAMTNTERSRRRRDQMQRKNATEGRTNMDVHIDENDDLNNALAMLTPEKMTFTADELSEFLLEVAHKVSDATKTILELELEPGEDEAVALTVAEFRAVACAVRWLALSGGPFDAIGKNDAAFRAWLSDLPNRGRSAS
jgi:hypothetical protein